MAERVDPSDVPSAGGPRVSRDVAEAFSQVARDLQAEAAVQPTLDEIVASAVAIIPAAEMAGLLLVHNRRRIESAAWTHELVAQLDGVQNATGQGPCLESLWTQETVLVEDHRTEDRYPNFSPRAVELGVLSMLSFQLFVDDGVLGALNLFAARPGAFADEESRNLGMLFAAQAAVALAGAERGEGLTQALVQRDVIGQAKGILMERHRITPDAAFTLLVRASQRANRKLHAVAEHLAVTGELP